MINKKIKEKLSTLPKKPGSYQMLNARGEVIYVGKAINLYNRVNSYFKGAHDYKTVKLVQEIADFEYVVTKNEKEALILEYNLIKQFDPKYNIIFKDDKSYPYILLASDDIPYCRVVRIAKRNPYRGKLFGPYPDAAAANNTVKLIDKLFLTRKCKSLAKEYCLYYHLGQCPGYCLNEVAAEKKSAIKKGIEEFLKGNNTEILTKLKAQMKEAAEAMNYEKAAEYRDLIADINYTTVNEQAIEENRREDFDVFAYQTDDNYIAVVGLFIRNGKLINRDIKLMRLYGEEEEEFISYLLQFYQQHLAAKLLVLEKRFINETLAEVLTFPLKYFDRGFKAKMLKTAGENALEQLKQKQAIIRKDENYLDAVAQEFTKVFGYLPQRMEIFDNSHLGGTLTCGAMAVYTALKPDKKAYRYYRLKDSYDDLQSMHEMLYRRYFRAIKEGTALPDLIIVDGGYNQIRVAVKVLSDLALDIKLVGLKKDEHHNTAALVDAECATIDLDAKSPLFLFLASMQDEVHRFVIGYNRKLRQKKLYTSKLDGVKGLGEKRKLKLLRKYKSLKNIEKLSLTELTTVLPQDVAEALYQKIHEGEEDA